MIGKIITDIIDPLFTDIDWIEHYGGFTSPVILETAGNEGRVTTEIFPYSCGYAKEECEQNCNYLVPHKNKLSIVYWEALDDFTPLESEWVPPREGKHITQTARLVVWFNYQKMGYSCASDVQASMIAQLWGLVDQLTLSNTAEPGIKLIRFSSIAKSVTNDIDIFNKYSYQPHYRQLFKAPYAFFAIDFGFEWMIWNKCIPVV